MASTSVGSEKTLTGVSIGQYLIRRLSEYGVRDVFGIPGDYVLAFYAMMEKGPLRLIGCTREDCAGFAADAYARVNGIGAVCVTYCVGGLSLCNSIAGAYAEKSPVVVISGSPGVGERVNNPLLHHKVKDFQTQADVFRRLCGIDAELNDPKLPFAASTACWNRSCITSGRAISNCPATWWTSCRRGLIPLPPPAGERPGGAGRGRGGGRGADRRRPLPGNHRRRGNPSLRPAG